MMRASMLLRQTMVPRGRTGAVRAARKRAAKYMEAQQEHDGAIIVDLVPPTA